MRLLLLILLAGFFVASVEISAQVSQTVRTPRWEYDPMQREISGYSAFGYDGRHYVQLLAQLQCGKRSSELHLVLVENAASSSFAFREDQTARDALVIFDKGKPKDGYITWRSSTMLTVNHPDLAWKMRNKTILRIELTDVLTDMRDLFVVFDLHSFMYEYDECKDALS